MKEEKKISLLHKVITGVATQEELELFEALKANWILYECVQFGPSGSTSRLPKLSLLAVILLNERLKAKGMDLPGIKASGV